MKKSEKIAFIWAGVIIFILSWPPVYFFSPLIATVVDKQTGKPLEGAIVIWHWELHTTDLFSSHAPYKTIVVGEAVTNEKGRFRLTSGPRLHFPPIITWLSSDQPTIFVFKPGYAPKSDSEDPDSKTALLLARRTSWHWQKIELLKRDRYSSAYAEEVRSLDTGLDFLRYGSDCEWQKIPRMLVAIHREKEFFETHSVELARGYLSPLYSVHETDGCESAETFFKDYL